MKHFYNELYGFFDFESTYKRYAKIVPTNGVIVEIGCFCGKSTSFLGVELFNLHKNVTLYAVDTWKGMENATPGSEDDRLNSYIREHHGGDLYEFFISNMSPISSLIKPIRSDSIQASKTFEDKSIDILFLDGDHTYDYVVEELRAWYPKVKRGGIIAGHDYDCSAPNDGVNRAVNKIFKYKTIKQPEHNIWEIEK